MLLHGINTIIFKKQILFDISQCIIKFPLKLVYTVEAVLELCGQRSDIQCNRDSTSSCLSITVL